MSWLDELARTDPALAADYRLVGNIRTIQLRALIQELSAASRTADEDARLEAAKRILQSRKAKR